MSYADYIRDLLAPLCIYQLTGGPSGGEVAGQGAALDSCSDTMALVRQEMLVSTAEGTGLTLVEQMLGCRPVTDDLAQRQASLAALLRIGGDSFTLEAINDNLQGCGLNAVASEGDSPGLVEVRFPDVPGIPEGFAEMQVIMEEILPCHLGITYVYWYVTWQELAAKVANWTTLQALDMDWDALAKYVY